MDRIPLLPSRWDALPLDNQNLGAGKGNARKLERKRRAQMCRKGLAMRAGRRQGLQGPPPLAASHSDLWASHCTLKKSVTNSASPSLPNPRQSGTASPSTEIETSHTEGETEAEGGIGVQASRSCKLGSQSQDAPWVLPGPAPSPGHLPAMTLV